MPPSDSTTPARGAHARLVEWSPEEMLPRLDEALEVYVEAMDYPRSVLVGRRGFVAGHLYREGFRAVATLEEGTDRLLGFGYGYVSRPGQWWHEQVRGGVIPPEYTRWLADAFELVELHVLPEAQGRGYGEAQLRALLTKASGATVLLSTPEGDTRAWRLYRRLGFVDVLRNHLFPGDDRPFAVLARTLPLDPPER